MANESPLTAYQYQRAHDLAVEFYEHGLILESTIDDQIQMILGWTDEALQQIKEVLNNLPEQAP